MKQTKLIIAIILTILLISIVTADIMLTTFITLDRTIEDKITLSKIGDGIGTIQKVKEVCSYNSKTDTELCINEIYIDKPVLKNNGCIDKYCYYTIYQEDGINKKFRIQPEQVCDKMGTCIEEELGNESYDCCLEYRAETNEELIKKAEQEMDKILNKIISVTLDRESRIQSNEMIGDIKINV